MKFRSAVVVVVLSLVAGCARDGAPPEPTPAVETVAAIAPVKLGDVPGIHNLVQVTPWLYSGSQPEGAEAFAELEKLGVKTLVCVDGMAPDAPAARAHGIRVVHLPIGYDAVPAETAAAYARLAAETEGPIYVHCHHGLHRGPAAAAIMIRARDKASAAQAAEFMTLAGTSPHYTGLWRDVEAFDPAKPGRYDGTFPEAAAVPDYAAGMAHIDRTWDRLKLIRKAGWKTPADHPDVAPDQEALILAEAFREINRLPQPHDEPRYTEMMNEAIRATASLADAMRQPAPDAAVLEAAFSATAASCRQCHQVYRD